MTNVVPQPARSRTCQQQPRRDVHDGRDHVVRADATENECPVHASWQYDKSGLDSMVNGAAALVSGIGDTISKVDMPDSDMPW